jgi:hypothetical protein
VTIEGGGVGSHWGDEYTIREGEGPDGEGGEERRKDRSGGEWGSRGIGLGKGLDECFGSIGRLGRHAGCGTN